MKRIIIIIAGFSSFFLMSFLITEDQPKYKNLKVLPKNTSKQEMDTLMKRFSASLGVKCNYCHKFNQEQKTMDFASDEVEKKKEAREMMRLTTKINKKYFNYKTKGYFGAKQAVTCYSCHNGHDEPATIPPLPARKEGPPGNPPPAK